MAFPRFLDTEAMSEFVICHFQWNRRGKAFPPSPFPKDFRSLCPDFDLTTTEQAAAQYELPEVPQVIFYAMLLNEAEKLGVLHGPRVWSLEVALTELRCGAFESCIWLFDDQVYEARFRPQGNSGEGARAGVRERWLTTLGRPSPGAGGTPRPLPEDFNVLCSCFSLVEAEAAAAESGMPEIIQATFYAMLLNEMLELGAIHEYTAEKMGSLLEGLRWSDFEVWMCIMDDVIRGAQLCHQLDEVVVKGARDGVPPRATRSRPNFYFAPFVLSCFPLLVVCINRDHRNENLFPV
ncbi:hypothetical protein Cgig2_008794 [Carnegiea gigantea]|uniref:Uncharacterized protein n=1 Tax=Carnegiea gigantea TaxID=171969 RepID=A0A9Q1JR38_9CARY|nr:hypothetical protein Cgig2_008794 [Carnegiea gigantea]